MRIAMLTFLLFAMCGVGGAFCKPLETYISESQLKVSAGETDAALQIMQKALGEYPDNPTVLGYIGWYTGTKAREAFEAGNTGDAGKFVTISFEYLDKALGIDAKNVAALFFRGVEGVNIPDFFQKLDQSIVDLETLEEIAGKAPGQVPDALRFPALDALGDGYQKQGKQEKAEEAWKRIVTLAPNTPWAEQAGKKLKNAETPSVFQSKALDKLAETVPAIRELKAKLDKDPNNPRLLCDLAKAVGTEAEKGYDRRIHDDTNFRTNLAVDVVNLLSRASKAAPEDQSIRLASGRMSVMMPFFVNRLAQGMSDLETVARSNAPDSLKAEALFWLGYAYQKKATTQWIQVIKQYPNSPAASISFEQMIPPMKHFDRSRHTGPVVVVDFLLGFRDELEPQTAVWVDDGTGAFVRTLYVSGFSGNAREKQVNLPEWAQASKFSDADAVTGASINIGHHLYAWDLTDASGKKVAPGTYTVHVEVCYWPSMEYQETSAKVVIGKKEYSGKVEEGKFIPYLGVEYYPR